MPATRRAFSTSIASRHRLCIGWFLWLTGPGQTPSVSLLQTGLLANPPFNDSDWVRTDDDVRWQFGVPPKGNANFAWVAGG